MELAASLNTRGSIQAAVNESFRSFSKSVRTLAANVHCTSMIIIVFNTDFLSSILKINKSSFFSRILFNRDLVTARYFLTRALLGVENFVEAQKTLRNEGCGAAEGFSVNMTFLAQEGDRMFHNAEVGPAEANASRSQLNILTISPDENTSHCNK